MISLQQNQGKNQERIRLELTMEEILSHAKEGLLALAVQTELQVFQAMMEENVIQLAGPKRKHNPRWRGKRMYWWC